MIKAGVICYGYELIGGKKWIYRKSCVSYQRNEKRPLTLQGMWEIRRIADETQEGSVERNERMQKVWDSGTFTIE